MTNLMKQKNRVFFRTFYRHHRHNHHNYHPDDLEDGDDTTTHRDGDDTRNPKDHHLTQQIQRTNKLHNLLFFFLIKITFEKTHQTIESSPTCATSPPSVPDSSIFTFLFQWVETKWVSSLS